MWRNGKTFDISEKLSQQMQDRMNVIALQKNIGLAISRTPGLLSEVWKRAPKQILRMGMWLTTMVDFVTASFKKTKGITTVRTGKELPFLYRWSLKKSKKI